MFLDVILSVLDVNDAMIEFHIDLIFFDLITTDDMMIHDIR